jgi:hypothetical protein
MRFLSIYRPASGEEGAMPAPEHMAEMGRFTQEMLASGHLLSTEPLRPRAQCARVSLSGGSFTVSPETERAGGYALLEAESLEQAVELCKRFLSVAGDGVTELRPILDFAPPKP